MSALNRNDTSKIIGYSLSMERPNDWFIFLRDKRWSENKLLTGNQHHLFYTKREITTIIIMLFKIIQRPEYFPNNQALESPRKHGGYYYYYYY